MCECVREERLISNGENKRDDRAEGGSLISEQNQRAVLPGLPGSPTS